MLPGCYYFWRNKIYLQQQDKTVHHTQKNKKQKTKYKNQSNKTKQKEMYKIICKTNNQNEHTALSYHAVLSSYNYFT